MPKKVDGMGPEEIPPDAGDDALAAVVHFVSAASNNKGMINTKDRIVVRDSMASSLYLNHRHKKQKARQPQGLSHFMNLDLRLCSKP
jgi:hypothetical protein